MQINPFDRGAIVKKIQFLKIVVLATVVAGSSAAAFADQQDAPVQSDGYSNGYGQGMMGGHGPGMMMGNSNGANRDANQQHMAQSESLSHGEQLEQEFCIQCHAMPDPRQHTAQQWPYVVARMNNYMHYRRMPAPDTQQTNEIIRYLAKYAPY